jgi:hypothetical protein
MNHTKKQAARIVDEAGQAGGIDEVRRLAKWGWPKSATLENDSPELREAVQALAQDVVDSTFD